MPTNTPEFPALLTAEDAVKQQEADDAARKAAFEARQYKRLATALRLIDAAGYTSIAERLLDEDDNATACRDALVDRLVSELGLAQAATCSTDRDRARDVADKLIAQAADAMHRAKVCPRTQRRIDNLIAHGSPDALPVS